MYFRANPELPWLPLSVVMDAIPAMEKRGVSEVARSKRGFIPAYKKAGGDPAKLQTDSFSKQRWRDRRNNFCARHMAQLTHLWEKDGAPTRRHLALVAWAYSPEPKKLVKWLKNAKRNPLRKNPPTADADGYEFEKRREIMEYYIQHCGIDRSEARSLVGTGRAKRTERGSLTPDELKIYERSVKRFVKNPVVSTIMLLLPRTGLRINEMCTLPMTALRNENGRIGLRFIGKGQNGGKERFVPLSKKMQALMRVYLEWRKTSMNANSPYLFTSMGDTGNHAQASTVRQKMNTLAYYDPRLKGLTPHVLRHTFASIKISQCADPRWVQQVMGHATKTMMYGYVHPSAWA